MCWKLQPDSSSSTRHAWSRCTACVPRRPPPPAEADGERRLAARLPFGGEEWRSRNSASRPLCGKLCSQATKPRWRSVPALARPRAHRALWRVLCLHPGRAQRRRLRRHATPRERMFVRSQLSRLSGAVKARHCCGPRGHAGAAGGGGGVTVDASAAEHRRPESGGAKQAGRQRVVLTTTDTKLIPR